MGQKKKEDSRRPADMDNAITHNAMISGRELNASQGDFASSAFDVRAS